MRMHVDAFFEGHFKRLLIGYVCSDGKCVECAILKVVVLQKPSDMQQRKLAVTCRL